MLHQVDCIIFTSLLRESLCYSLALTWFWVYYYSFKLQYTWCCFYAWCLDLWFYVSGCLNFAIGNFWMPLLMVRFWYFLVFQVLFSLSDWHSFKIWLMPFIDCAFQTFRYFIFFFSKICKYFSSNELDFIRNFHICFLL